MMNKVSILTRLERRMIRLVCGMSLAAGVFCACSDLSDDVETLKERVTALEAWQQTVNGNISAIQEMIGVLQASDHVMSVTPLPDGSGYTMTFARHEPVVIHHGVAGEAAPQISVVQTDGVWYWTLGGERISDGAGGYLHVAGITPRVRIHPDSFEWEISVDNGLTWTSTGVQASGESFFSKVDVSHAGYVEITLAGEPPTVIRIPKYRYEPRILSFAFKASDNPLALLEDVACEINDSVIQVLVPYVMPGKRLTPVFSFEGKTVQIEDQVQQSGVTRVDFSSPVVYTVSDTTGKTRKYTVKVYAFNGLPMVYIDTRKQPVNSTETYVNATITVTNTLNGHDCEMNMRIRGRGNSTWTFFPKKPYRIKLDDEAAMFGMPPDEDWVLLANYSDKSLLRTAAGFELSRLVGMPWTPRMQYVDVFLNGEYAGQYLFGEHVKVSPDRIRVENGGWLGEINVNFYDREPFHVFSTSYRYPYTFKKPDPATDENTAYFMNLVNAFEATLKRRDFSLATGYRNYIDVESFAQWYVISQFIASCDPNRYYFVENGRDGVLRRSPVWDLDCTFGYTYPDWKVTSVMGPDYEAGYEYLGEILEDPYFRQVVEKYWVKVKADLPQLYRFINETAQQIRRSALADYERWGDTFAETVVKKPALQKWENEVQELKIFLSKRTVWMDARVKAEWQ